MNRIIQKPSKHLSTKVQDLPPLIKARNFNYTAQGVGIWTDIAWNCLDDGLFPKIVAFIQKYIGIACSQNLWKCHILFHLFHYFVYTPLFTSHLREDWTMVIEEARGSERQRVHHWEEKEIHIQKHWKMILIVVSVSASKIFQTRLAVRPFLIRVKECI